MPTPAKTLEQFPFSCDRTSIVNRFWRGNVVGVTLVAWFVISNHCALAVAISPPMAAQHTHCHGGQPQPSQKGGDEQLPCCKVLRATVSKTITLSGSIDRLWQSNDYAKIVDLISVTDFECEVISTEFDTGPPLALSFAELILQRSLLSHAPPRLI
jgi:hypothetical protein